MGTLGGTLPAAHAVLLIDHRLTLSVLLHLAPAGTAAHAQVLNGAAKAGLLMTLEVGQRNDHVSLHNGLADLGRGDVLRALHRHLHVIVTTQAVADNNLTAGRQRRKAILKGGLQMLQGILPTTRIQGVAVGQEGHAAQTLYHIRNYFRVVGPQKGQIARLSEVHLDGYQFMVKIDLADPGGADQLLQLIQQVFPRLTAQVRVVYLCLFHRCNIPPSLHCNVYSTYFIPVFLEPQVLFLCTPF